MDEPTLEEYIAAQKMILNYKICGNVVYGCNHVFKVEDVIHTIRYGQTYYWCPKCYEGIKDD